MERVAEAFPPLPTCFHMINKDTANRLKRRMVNGETGEVVEDGQKGAAG